MKKAVTCLIFLPEMVRSLYVVPILIAPLTLVPGPYQTSLKISFMDLPVDQLNQRITDECFKMG